MQKESSISLDLTETQLGLTLFIDADKEHTLFVNDDIGNHEAKFQLREGHYYDYTFSDPNFRLACSNQNNIISTRKRDKHCGRIAPNIFVGTLSLEFYHINDSDKKGTIELEVQSIKTTYRKDYQFMLNEIADKCTDLILQANSPVSHTFETDPECDNETLYQRFAFIKAMIESEDFDNAVQRIIISPTTKWKSEEELTDVRSIKRYNPSNIRQLLNGSNKMHLNSSSHLRNYGVDSIATKIEAKNKRESVDTAENRFIKHALTTFLHFCEDLELHKNAGKRLKSEARETAEILDSYLQQNLFKDISKPTTLKLNSPVLQKKAGYREILKTWLKYDLAAKLIWNGGEEVYSAGKKDIATLYEYWLFFKLLELLEKMFVISSKDLEDLIEPSKDGLSLQLKQGAFTALRGVYYSKNRDLKIRFNYNRSFRGNSNIQSPGSWTTTLRPDYTLSIWPSSLKENDAEKEEQIVHIHFDAKYKIANIHQILDNKEDDALNTEKKENLEGIYKNADLLKMHAYKDAIRRTAGAYILYPGGIEKNLKGFHEVLPGLGAFPISPSQGEDTTRSLESFLNDLLEHFLNRATQRENIATKTYEITKDGKGNPLNESIPEYIDGRKLIPDETFVLVGYARNPKRNQRMAWFKKHKRYNFRMGDKKGALKFTENEAKAKFLLIRDSTNGTATNLYKLKEGIQVFTGKELEKKGHPSASEDAYLIVDFELDVIPEFENVVFNYFNTVEYQQIIAKYGNTISAKGRPFATTLSQLMNREN